MMKRILLATAIIFLQLFAQPGSAQNTDLKFNLVLSPDGRPLGKINAITQDRHGYMWFCGSSERCLYRYDGNRILAFRHEDKNPNSLGIATLETVYADDEGMIWIGGEGLDQYNPATGVFKHFKKEPNGQEGPGGNFVYSILKDHLGRLWIGTGNGLELLNEKTGKSTRYQHEKGNPGSLSSNFIWRLYEDHQGVLWVATGYPFFNKDPEDGGLNRLNADGTFTSYKHDPNDPHSLINNKVAAIFEDNRGVFWVGTGGDGLHTMDRKTGKFERHLYDPRKPDQLSRPPVWQGKDSNLSNNDKITFISGDVNGDIWIGTMYSGINRYNAGTKKITHFENSNGFPDTKSWNSFTSKDGELWITTENANLFRVDLFRKPITSVITNSLVCKFLEDSEGYLWVATMGGGLLQYDRDNNLIQHYKHDPADSFSLPSDKMVALFQNQESAIWVGTEKGLRILNKASKQFSRFMVDRNARSTPDSNVSNIIEDSQGSRWFSTWGNGLFGYNSKNHSFQHFLSNAKDSSSISSNEVAEVLEDKPGTLWVSGSEGINRLDMKTGRFKHYLSHIWSTHLFKDAGGSVWTGNQNGLFRYNSTEDQFSVFFDPQQEINHYTVGGIVEDSAKNLWLPSELGIIKLNPVTKKTFIYGSKYGIDSRDLVLWAGTYKNRKGQVFIPHGNGFYTFSPEELVVKTDFKIIITDLFINSHSVSQGKGSQIQKPAEEINELDLGYNQNNIAFNFAAMDYRDPESLKYFTMLEGSDNTWREVKGEKSSYYFNLPKGKYIYKIKTFNIDGTKAEKEIIIRINPPWWETWWFRIITITFVITLLYTYIQYRSRTLKRSNLLLEKKVMERTNELNNSLAELKTTQDQLIQSEKMASLGELTSGIAHEIKNPLNFINNFSEINMELLAEIEEEQNAAHDEKNEPEITPLIKTLKKNSEKINHHGKRIDEIVKGMLQHSRQGNITKEPVNINVLCDESLKLAYHGFRAKEKSFNASFETRLDPELPRIMAVPQDLGRVLLNLINNAFYTVYEKKKRNQPQSAEDTLQAESLYKPCVIVSTKKSGDKIIITVSDNGTGIPSSIITKIFQPFFTTKPTGEGTGLGLSMSYDIIAKGHGGELRAKSKEGVGTDFEIILPVS